MPWRSSILPGYSAALAAYGTGFLALTAAAATLHIDGESVSLIAGSYLVANILLHFSVLASRRVGGISLMVSFFFLFFVAIPAFLQTSNNVFPGRSGYTGGQLAGAFFVLSLGQLGYQTGEAFAVRRGIAISRKKTEYHIRHTRRRLDPHLMRTVIAMVVIACTVLIVLVGPQSLLSPRFAELGAEGNEWIQPQLLYILRSLALFNVIACISLRRGDVIARSLPFMLPLFLATLGILAATHYPPALSRFQLLGALLAITATLVDYFAPAVRAVASAIASVFFVAVFPSIKALGGGAGLRALQPSLGGITEYLTRSLDLDVYTQVVDATIYLQHHGMRYGTNFLGVALYFVPRSIWQGKPIHSGMLVSGGLGYPFTNVASPLPSEGQLSFGLFGVFSVMLVLAWIVVSLERSARDSQRLPGIDTAMLAYALLVGFSTIILRGALNAVAPMFLTAFYACGFTALANRRRVSALLRLKASPERLMMRRSALSDEK